MVSELKFEQKDPQPGKNRGRGWYYFRGALKQANGRRIKTWSKYNEKVDAILPHKRTIVKKVPKSEKFAPHKGDYKTKGANGTAGRRTKRLATSTTRGYF